MVRTNEVTACFTDSELRDRIIRLVEQLCPIRTLWDLSEYSGTTLSGSQMEQVCHEVASRQQSPEGRLAIVAPSDVLFGVCRALEVYSLGNFPYLHVGVFRTQPAAQEWLASAERLGRR